VDEQRISEPKFMFSNSIENANLSRVSTLKPSNAPEATHISFSISVVSIF